MLPLGIISPTEGSNDSMLPPVSNVITGVPHDKASMLVVGKLSSSVGFTNTDAMLYNAANSLTSVVRRMPIHFCGGSVGNASFVSPTITKTSLSSK